MIKKIIALTSDNKIQKFFKEIGVIKNDNPSSFLNNILIWIQYQKDFYENKRDDAYENMKNSYSFTYEKFFKSTQFEEEKINEYKHLIDLYKQHGKDSLIHRMIEKYCEDKHYGFISTQTPNNDTTIYEVFPHVEDIAKLFIENATDENGIIDEEKVPETVIIYAPDYDQYRRKNKNKPKNIH